MLFGILGAREVVQGRARFTLGFRCVASWLTASGGRQRRGLAATRSKTGFTAVPDKRNEGISWTMAILKEG